MSPILDSQTLEFFSRSAEQTQRVGMRLGALLRTGDLVGLAGDLGTGKTTLVRGLVAGWGSPDLVSSPTFVLLNSYRHPDGRRFFHMDAYRLHNPAEAADLDIDWILASGPLVVEWADQIFTALPGEGIWVQLRYVDDQRRDLRFRAQGVQYQEMLNVFKQRIYGV